MLMDIQDAKLLGCFTSTPKKDWNLYFFNIKCKLECYWKTINIIINDWLYTKYNNVQTSLRDRHRSLFPYARNSTILNYHNNKTKHYIIYPHPLRIKQKGKNIIINSLI